MEVITVNITTDKEVIAIPASYLIPDDAVEERENNKFKMNIISKTCKI